MPIYEYRCPSCGHVWETIVSGFNVSNPICDGCGTPSEKQVSSSSFQLNGKGWYKNDYGSKIKTTKDS